MNPNPSAPGLENSSSNGDAIAAEFLARELPKARRTLRRTQIVGVILILLVGAYIGVISTIMVGFFEPKAAAEVASGMLNQHLATDGPVILAHVEREIPQVIHDAPDLLIKEIPTFRHQIQDALTADCQTYCNTLVKEWGTRMDEYIDTHKTEIRTLLENAGDREAIRKTLPDFDKLVLETLRKNNEGQAAKERLDAWAAALSEVDERVDRLANGQNLSPEEIKARHALAMLSPLIKQHTQLPETVPAPVKPAKH